MSNIIERRAHQRIERSEAVALKIVFTSDNPLHLGKTLDGETVDVSASALMLSMDKPLKVHSTIDVKVTMRPDDMEYFLSAKVRSCKQVEDGSYRVGVALQELFDTDTDYEAWQSAVR